MLQRKPCIPTVHMHSPGEHINIFSLTMWIFPSIPLYLLFRSKQRFKACRSVLLYFPSAVIASLSRLPWINPSPSFSTELKEKHNAEVQCQEMCAPLLTALPVLLFIRSDVFVASPPPPPPFRESTPPSKPPYAGCQHMVLTFNELCSSEKSEPFSPSVIPVT